MRTTYSFWVAATISMLYAMVDGATSYGNITTSFYGIDGPWIKGGSFTWSKYITPTIVGTVIVIINTDTNRTMTKTKTNTEYATNGTLSILTRTDTNPAGTVTDVVRWGLGINSTISYTVAYPTHVLALETNLTWSAILPTIHDNTLCCTYQETFSPTPTHKPFPSPTGSTDIADPSGWLYLLMEFETFLASDEVSSLWDGQSIGIQYSGCRHTMCKYSTYFISPAQTAQSNAFLFTTNTITTSGSDTSTVAVDAATAELKSAAQTTSASTYASSVETHPPITKVTSTSGNKTPTETQSGSSVSNSDQSTIGKTSTSPIPSVKSADNTAQVSTRATDSSVVPFSPSSSPSSSAPLSIPSEAVMGSETSSPQQESSLTTGSPQTSMTLENSTPGRTGSTALPSAAVTAPSASQGESSAENQPGTAHDQAFATPSNVGTALKMSADSGAPVGSVSSATVVVLPTDFSGSTVQVDSSTKTINASPTTSTTEYVVPIAIGSSIYRSDASSNYVVSGQTLALGSTITIGSDSVATVLALQTSGSLTLLAIGSSTSALSQQYVVASVDTAPPPAFTFGSSIVVPNSASEYIISSQTLSPGGSAITVGGTAISIASVSTALIVGSDTKILDPKVTSLPASSVLQNFILGSSLITPDSASGYIIGSQTLQPGGEEIFVSGTAISLASNAATLVVASGSDAVTSRIAAPTPTSSALLPAVTLYPSVIVPGSNSEYFVGSQTLSPGGSAITVSGTAFSLASGASSLIIGTGSEAVTSPVSSIETVVPGFVLGSVITLGTPVNTPDTASGYVIGSQTLLPGAETVLSGTTISFASGATEVVIGSSTVALKPQTPPPSWVLAEFTFGSSLVTPNSASEYVIASQTLSPGTVITVSGTPISLARYATEVIIGSSTVALEPQIPPSTGTIAKFTFGSSVVTPNSASEYVIASQTLSPGSVIIVSGTLISLASGNTEVVIGSNTVALTSQAGLGGYIWSELGGTTTAKITASSQQNGMPIATETIHFVSSSSRGSGVTSLSAATSGGFSSPSRGASGVTSLDATMSEGSSSAATAQSTSSSNASPLPSPVQLGRWTFLSVLAFVIFKLL